MIIMEFVEVFNEKKANLIADIKKNHPTSYQDLFRRFCALLTEELGEYGAPNPDRIHRIDDGDYQGTLVFIVGSGGMQPHLYWSTMVSYGSCSHCDTFDAINEARCWDEEDDDTLTHEQVHDYMTLLLHMIQRMKAL